MGFFKSLINKEDSDEASTFSGAEQMSDKDLETLYKKLYMKIGRDFVHKGDFTRVVEELSDAAEIEEEVSLHSDESAVELAFEYKDLLESDREDTTKYKDLIDLSE